MRIDIGRAALATSIAMGIDRVYALADDTQLIGHSINFTIRFEIPLLLDWLLLVPFPVLIFLLYWTDARPELSKPCAALRWQLLC
jgi:hypothetical protein